MKHLLFFIYPKLFFLDLDNLHLNTIKYFLRPLYLAFTHLKTLFKTLTTYTNFKRFCIRSFTMRHMWLLLRAVIIKQVPLNKGIEKKNWNLFGEFISCQSLNFLSRRSSRSGKVSPEAWYIYKENREDGWSLGGEVGKLAKVKATVSHQYQVSEKDKL